MQEERPEKCPTCGDPSLEAAGPDDNDEDFWYCSTCGWTQGVEPMTYQQALAERDAMR